jgi:cytochrome c peroxidase
VPGDHAEFDRLSEAKKAQVNLAIQNWGKALAAYLRRLKSQPTRVDAFLMGDSHALTHSEIRGLKIFAGKGRCLECHSGPLLTDQKFHNLGIKAEYVAVVFINPYDPGAGEGRFKTPSLRNSGTPSYMHTGQFRSLKQVIEFLDRGGDRQGYVGSSELKPLGLTQKEKSDLEALLVALRSPPASDGL